MKLKQLVLMGGLIALFTHTHTHTQAQQPKWVVNNSIVDLTTQQVSPNNLAANPDNTQNAVWDKEGNLQFYEEDGIVYNAVGQVLSIDVAYGHSLPPTTGHSEFIFVPIPGECDRWYGITLDKIGKETLYEAHKDLILSYSVLDASLNQGNGGVIQTLNTNFPYNNLMNVNWIKINQLRAESSCNDKFHIGVTQLQQNGNKRYLFATACLDLMIFEITQNGIEEVHQGEFEYQGAIAFRSELEISEDESHIRVAFGTVTQVTRSDGQIVEVGGIDIYTFSRHYSGDLQFVQHQEFELGSRYDDIYIVKGLEFSTNEKNLYATYVKMRRGGVHTNPNDMIKGTNIIHLSRGSSPITFGLFPEIDLGPGTEDFSLGMIEKGRGNELLFIRNTSIGRWYNGNDPNSSFNPDYIQLETPTTNHTPLWPTSFNMFTKIRLLPDQIDGEDFSETIYNTDQFPETLYVCKFPSTVSSPFMTNWNLTTSTNGGIGLGIEMEMAIPSEGLVTTYYQNDHGCEVAENFYITLYPVTQYGANFTHSNIVDPNGVTISLTPLATVYTGHNWTIQKMNGNNWITFASSSQTYPVFSNLDPNIHYRVEHEILPFLPFECLYSPSSAIIVY